MTQPSATEEAGPDVAPASQAGESLSYGAMVWSELRKNRLSVFGLYCIAVLFFLAIVAPLVSMSQPLVFADGDGVRFPFLGALFNRLIFESAVDIFFNLLLVLGPVYFGWYWFRTRSFGRTFTAKHARVIGRLAAFHAVLFVAMTPESVGPVENPLHVSRPVINYRAEASRFRWEERAPFAVFPPRPYGYRDTDPAHGVEPPSRAHWLGTDAEGRDVFARMLYGTRVSLTIGVVAVGIYVALGVFLGAMAGYYGGVVDLAVSRVIEVMICFPSFFLILTLAALIQERSIFHVMVIIGITSWPGVARLVRAEFLKHRGLEYAQAAVALGIPTRRIIFGHILPNAMAPVLVTATFGIASAILVESSLSFLGIGDLTVASWGETLNTGRLENKLWLILAPGFAIFFVVTVFNLVGEGLRDALDPKLRS